MQTHRPRFGFLRQPAVRREIASLDAERDCQRIVHLLACHEFAFDLTRCLELALFHTYGSRSVSRLLAATGEFQRRGQKRYDDTRLLISHFLESGYDSDAGQRAIARMNAIHGRFRIPNDDFLFVLSTFVSYPYDWIGRYGYRPLTPHERHAWWCFFREVGRRMGIAGVPDEWEALQRFVAGYEAAQLVYAPSNRGVADATVAVFAGWFPRPLRFLVQPTVRALIGEPLRAAFGYAPAPRAWGATLQFVLGCRKRLKRFIHLERQPKLIANTRNRTYPGNRYRIEDIGPEGRREPA
jgi:hypothetical protein